VPGLGNSGIGGGGGGGEGPPGGNVPQPPGAGDVLTSTGSGPLDYAWLPPGGFAISTFTGFTQTKEVGGSVVNPTIGASYNTIPDNAHVNWTNPTGGPLNLTTPFTSGTITATFADTVIGHTSTATLTAVKGSTTKTATQTITWAGSIAFGSVSGTLTAGQTLYDTLRADGFQLHTANGGSYAFASASGVNQVFAIPAGFGTPTVKDGNGFIYTPTLIGTSTITENGTSQSFNFFTVGSPGSTVTFTLS
jgi:hypothetical protein